MSNLIPFTVLSYLRFSLFFYLLGVHCTMLTHHIMPLYSAYELKYMWQFFNIFISYDSFYSDKISIGFVD